MATYNFSERRINVQLSHALGNVHITLSRVRSLSLSPGRRVLVWGFYTPLNIYARNVKVKERCSSLAVGAAEIWDKLPEERKPTSQSWLGHHKQMPSAQIHVILHLEGYHMPA